MVDWFHLEHLLQVIEKIPFLTLEFLFFLQLALTNRIGEERKRKKERNFWSGHKPLIFCCIFRTCISSGWEGLWNRCNLQGFVFTVLWISHPEQARVLSSLVRGFHWEICRRFPANCIFLITRIFCQISKDVFDAREKNMKILRYLFCWNRQNSIDTCDPILSEMVCQECFQILKTKQCGWERYFYPKKPRGSIWPLLCRFSFPACCVWLKWFIPQIGKQATVREGDLDV